jgi:hypothetical protein
MGCRLHMWLPAELIPAYTTSFTTVRNKLFISFTLTTLLCVLNNLNDLKMSEEFDVYVGR